MKRLFLILVILGLAAPAGAAPPDRTAPAVSATARLLALQRAAPARSENGAEMSGVEASAVMRAYLRRLAGDGAKPAGTAARGAAEEQDAP